MLALLLALAPEIEGVTARWRCEPGEVALGEPFALVLELEHPTLPPGTSPRELAGGALELDPSWVVLGEDALASESGLTRRAWRVASLEPGERSLSEVLSAFALPESVARIRLGDAHVRVAGVLGAGEDAPRPLRGPGDGFADVDVVAAAAGGLAWVLAAVTGAVIGGLLVLVRVWLRRRGRAPRASAASPLERLAALEGALEERSRESCYALTRLVRESADRADGSDRAGLTDEEWLGELGARRALSPEALAELGAVLEHAARVKYGGETPTPWALRETFARARAALAAVGGGGGGSAEATR